MMDIALVSLHSHSEMPRSLVLCVSVYFRCRWAVFDQTNLNSMAICRRMGNDFSQVNGINRFPSKQRFCHWRKDCSGDRKSFMTLERHFRYRIGFLYPELPFRQEKIISQWTRHPISSNMYRNCLAIIRRRWQPVIDLNKGYEDPAAHISASWLHLRAQTGS
jgi:hypothetical protein